MKSTIAASLALVLMGTAAAHAQDYKAGALRIEAPWTRATPVGSKVAGGFMKIENTGKEADRLVGGSATVAGKFEVHEMAMENDVMKMRELAGGLEIAPGGSVELKPGSFHVMFIDLKGTLKFEKAGTVEVEYAVRAMGAQADGELKKH